MNQKKKQPDFMKPGIGNQFQEETKYAPDRIGNYSLNWKTFPEPFKNYDNPIAVIGVLST